MSGGRSARLWRNVVGMHLPGLPNRRPLSMESLPFVPQLKQCHSPTEMQGFNALLLTAARKLTATLAFGLLAAARSLICFQLTGHAGSKEVFVLHSGEFHMAKTRSFGFI